MKNIFETIRNIISEPKKFFRSVSKYKTFNDALYLFLIFYAVTMGISFLQGIVQTLAQPVQAAGTSRIIILASMLFGMFFGLVFSMVFALLFMFLGILIVHGFFRLFRGKGAFKDTFNLIIYSSVPGYLLGIIVSVFIFLSTLFISDPNMPLVMMLFMAPIYIGAFVWQIVLITIGGSILHKISKLHSFLAGFLMPFILGLVITGIILLIVFLFLSAFVSIGTFWPF